MAENCFDVGNIYGFKLSRSSAHVNLVIAFFTIPETLSAEHRNINCYLERVFKPALN